MMSRVQPRVGITAAPWLALSLSAILALSAFPSSAQTIREDLDVPNGPVFALAKYGTTLYVGGSFTRIGAPSGAGVPVGEDGLPIAGFPRVTGNVRAVVPDGAGGWFIGGSFSSVGGLERSSIAHIREDLSVSEWNPGCAGSVSAMVFVDGILYFGGSFSAVGGQARNSLAAVNATTGQPTSWNPDVRSGTWDYVSALCVLGNTLYVGGDFYSIGGQPRSALASVDLASGLPTSWNPGPFSRVSALVARDSSLYVGGSFWGTLGAPHDFLVEFNVVTGAITDWNPHVSGEVRALAVTEDLLYAGGDFQWVGDQQRRGVAAIERNTGVATDWNPDGDGIVMALASRGTTVLAGGSFGTIGGEARSCVAALDATTGLATLWRPEPNNAVWAIGSGPTSIYLGGGFQAIGTMERKNAAAIDLVTGRVTDWNPNVDSDVMAMAVDAGSVYIGGAFWRVGGQTHPHLAAVDRVSGIPRNWTPNPNSDVRTIIARGNTIYVAGLFSHIEAVPRPMLAALDSASGLATEWQPLPVSGDSVRSITVVDSTVYVGEGWSIAALDVSSAARSPWNPDYPRVQQTFAMASDEGKLYVGGSYFVGAFDLVSGHLLWSIPTYVKTLTAHQGIVYSDLGYPRKLRAIDGRTGLELLWNPAPDGNVYALLTDEGIVYAGGSFARLGEHPQSFLAAISEATRDVSTPVLVAGATVESNPESVRLNWHAAIPIEVTVQRRNTTGAWRAVGNTRSNEAGDLVYEDVSVVPGTRYGYRLAWFDSGKELLLGETWVDVPVSPRLALKGMYPNPASSLSRVEFDLSDASPASLEILDVLGRKVWAQDVGHLGGGHHELRIREVSLSMGIYLLRLTQDGRSLTANIVIAR